MNKHSAVRFRHQMKPIAVVLRYLFVVFISHSAVSMDATYAQTAEEKVALAEADKLNKEAIALFRAGKHAEAEPGLQRALSIVERVLGPNHATFAAVLNNLATVHKAQGQYSKAEQLYQRSVAINEKRFPADHPEIALGLNNLAVSGVRSCNHTTPFPPPASP